MSSSSTKKRFVASPEETDFKFASEIGDDQNDDLFSDSDDDTDKLLAEIYASRRERDAKFSSNSLSEEEVPKGDGIHPKKSLAAAENGDNYVDVLDELVDDDEDEEFIKSIEACEKLGSLAKTDGRAAHDPYVEALFDEEDDFFDDLYSGFTIDRVEANRAINSNPDRRGAITELLIRNYP